MEILEEIAREHLPENIGVEWSGLSYQEKQAGGKTGLVLSLVFLFVFLFLAALYESWTVLGSRVAVTARSCIGRISRRVDVRP